MFCLILAVGLLLLFMAAGCGEKIVDPEESELTLGLGRDLFYGPEDRTFLHGSTNVWESLTYLD
ncbi:MAG: ABC transporter substrate-binding protein, partial [Firmicutes bacterium]|nr:ABC transporter substrate-binding protein [Bacillota bacterium]